jgi:hypothetical protein
MRVSWVVAMMLLAGRAGADAEGVKMKEVDRLADEAQGEYVARRYDKAIAKARAAIQLGDEHRGWMVIAGSGCAQKDKALVQEAYPHLTDPGKRLITHSCARYGVSLGGLPALPPGEVLSAQDEALLTQAQARYVDGKYEEAIRLANQVKGNGDHPRARRILATSNCFLGRRDAVVALWGSLDPPSRQLVKFVCQRNKIQVP